MVRSMTGFGRGEAEHRGGKAIVEVLTVNSRYLDVSVFGIREMAAEMALRKVAQEYINRGRVNITVQYGGTAVRGRTVAVNEDLVKEFAKGLDRVKWVLGIRERTTLDIVAARPELIEIVEEAAGGGIAEAVIDAASKALREVSATRAEEGKRLAEDVAGRLQKARAVLARIEELGPASLEGYRERLRARLRELKAEGIPEERVDMEVALFAERSDISEEITRYKSHLDAAASALKSDEPVGRRLEFLVQEMNREVNTIASKSQDAAVSAAVIESKELIEQIREQVQNIE